MNIDGSAETFHLSSRHHSPISLNFLTFYLIVLLVPLQFIMDSLGGLSPSVTPEAVIELTLLAIIFSYLNRGRPYQIWRHKASFLVILWLTICTIHIFFYAVIQRKFSLSNSSLVNLLPLLAGAILSRALWRVSPRFNELLAFMGAALLLQTFISISIDLMAEAIHHLRYVYDPVLYGIDSILWLGWVSVFGQILEQHDVLGNAVTFNYYYTSLWLVLAAISQSLNTPPSQAYLLLSLFVLGILGFVLYYLMPAVGPVYFFGGLFPDHLPPNQTFPLHQVLSPSAAFRNAMPSLHTASALVIYLALRKSPLWHRIIGAVVALCIVVSTLALGKHYAVDLVAAFPLVLFVRGVCAIYIPARQPARRNAIVAGGILTGLWVVAIRCAPASLEMPDLIRALAWLSVIAPVMLERELAKLESAFILKKRSKKRLVLTRSDLTVTKSV